MRAMRKRRLLLVALMITGVAIAVGLMLLALKQNINYYYDPTQVQAGEAPRERSFRIGGMVVEGSVKRETGKLGVNFILTDFKSKVRVHYEGLLPDLFREGQGVVALGYLTAAGDFIADEVLAKHDEKYMPPEVAASLKNKPKVQ